MASLFSCKIGVKNWVSIFLIMIFSLFLVPPIDAKNNNCTILANDIIKNLVTGENDYKALNHAISICKLYAQKGDSESQYQLSGLYSFLNTVEGNRLAKYWTIKSAENGNKISQYNLGMRFEEGNGLDKNLSMALKWYKKSAVQGYIIAQQRIGYNYIKGVWGKVNLEKGLKWYEMAGENGSVNSIKFLIDVYGKGYKTISPNKMKQQYWTKKLNNIISDEK